MEFNVFAAVLCDKVWNTCNSAFHSGTLIEARRLPQWWNPRPGRIRVFTDAAFKNNGGGAADMVVLNNASQILRLAAQCFKADSLLEAELLALKFGVESCTVLNWTNVVFFSDNLEVVNSITSSSCPVWSLLHLSLSICDVSRMLNYSVVWIPRTLNGSAHVLASWAFKHNHSGTFAWWEVATFVTTNLLCSS
ncbi:Ribonuclease H-like domain containing protein [Parasponia andersonii]|uniref:Ribonuclease H-like domain containing protein n=1 Tax=Parasponia andersonii TaxID=3476 RepID=A0A2P5AJY5_PARAD|nr:Ribonuclease H-like domain containing protein [Parasponia andersonii]